MWKQTPKRIYVDPDMQVDLWDRCHLGPCDTRSYSGFALTPDDTAQVELEAWSKLWRPRSVVTDPSAWSANTIASIIRHCPAGKASGIDRWGMGEFKLLSYYFPCCSAAPLTVSQDCCAHWGLALSLIHISEPTRPRLI
eukprot:3074951-Amphidinium_carterae.2